MKAVKLAILTLAIALPMAACGGKPKSKVAIEEAKPGRDRELLGDAIKDIRDGHEDSGRVMLETIINTYSDSPLVKAAKLAAADSYYLEGGSKGLAQAKAGYEDFLQFFPSDPLAPAVMLKIAETDMRQVQSPDRDMTHAREAEKELKELLRLHPDSSNKDDVQTRIREIDEFLAEHEMKVARFYFTNRQAPIATQQRTEEILNKYPTYSHFDEALYYHARSMEQQEDTETAAADLTRLIREYPHSEFVAKAKELLQSWKKPVPDPDPAKVNEPAPSGKGLVPKFFALVMGPKVNGLSSQGVIIDRSQKTEDLVARAQEISGVKQGTGDTVVPSSSTSTNATDTRARRSGEAGQDVEVKSGSDSGTDKNKKKKDNSQNN